MSAHTGAFITKCKAISFSASPQRTKRICLRKGQKASPNRAPPRANHDVLEVESYEGIL